VADWTICFLPGLQGLEEAWNVICQVFQCSDLHCVINRGRLFFYRYQTFTDIPVW
jgi:hypothetical protein